MNNTPVVSVIVPMYNVADHIEKCAESIFEQTLDDIEILFIDDCSPDNSSEKVARLLEQYPKRKPLTRIIRMPENSGLAGVRRKGILEATGDYVIHLDGDDWVDTDYYKALYDAAIENNADIVIGAEVEEFKTGAVPKRGRFNAPTGKDIIRNWYKTTLGMFCHNKLVRRSIYIDNEILPWVGLNMWEDNGLFARLFYYADRIVQIDGPVYHYNRCNEKAMTSGYGEKQVNQMIGIAKNISDFYADKPDAKEFEKTVNAFKYLAKLNLITDSFANYRRFKKLFPESDSIAKEIPLGAFSRKGQIRFKFVRMKLGLLFIMLFKIRKLLQD